MQPVHLRDAIVQLVTSSASTRRLQFTVHLRRHRPPVLLLHFWFSAICEDMSSSHGNTTNTNLASRGPNESVLKQKSDDIGWEFGHLIDPSNFDRVECKLCGKKFGGRVYRLKKHIAHISGNVAKCPRSTKEDQDRCKKAIESVRNKKKIKHKEERELRAEVDIDRIEEEEEIKGLRLDVDRLNNLIYVQFNAKLINKQKMLKNKELNIDVLLASDSDASNAQGWTVEDGDEGVELDPELSLQMVAEATGADGMTQP
ncbi:hypothetical protein Ddye_012681 [Dipteronia dyeriana]|uniref:BED-type domain-containing protein n=1 Tax=Dipteronia dyeriana TaxID=168575 RepID=A0AAE0CIW7_9ROSI|nr:hypothetical protein Ddye_012681 [Dipteronia dyeriana]